MTAFDKNIRNKLFLIFDHTTVLKANGQPGQKPILDRCKLVTILSINAWIRSRDEMVNLLFSAILIAGIACVFILYNGGTVMDGKLKLYGFNNLTKTLSFNIYDVCYAKTRREQLDYIKYIDEQYNSERLTNILCQVTEMIGAKVLSISKQDYEPQGASVTLMISEEFKINNNGSGESVVGHLDKSHVTVHTYPEYHPETSIATFRVDIDVSTCGEITPLDTLDYLIQSFDSDIITIDYRVRGFTRDLNGKKCFIDHDITSIQDYIDEKIKRKYDAVDVNVYQSNIFHSRLLIKDIILQNYLFKIDTYELTPEERLQITQNLRKEMIEIYSGRNIYD